MSSTNLGRTRAQTLAARHEDNGTGVNRQEAPPQMDDSNASGTEVGGQHGVAASIDGVAPPVLESQPIGRTVVATGRGPADMVINLSQEDVAWLRSRETGENVSHKGINIFHDHWGGRVTLPLEMLRIFAKDEVEKVKQWSEEMQLSMQKDLTNAIPEMSAVFGKEPWPAPVGFNAKQVQNMYIMILNFFLSKYSEEGTGVRAESLDPVEPTDDGCQVPEAGDVQRAISKDLEEISPVSGSSRRTKDKK